MPQSDTRCRSLAGLLATALLISCAGNDPHRGWASYGGAPDSAQFSALTQISRANVAQLRPVWTLPVSQRATTSPIIVGDRLFLVADKAVMAVNAATGEPIWSRPQASDNVRGLVYWQSKDGRDQRILVTHEDMLSALDARTGEKIVSFGGNGDTDLRVGLGRPVAGIGRIESGTPGRIFGNLLILGSSPGEGYGAAPGDIRAYDVRTGKLTWSFHTIPHPGEAGYESWPAEAWKKAGAANVWGEMTLDSSLGIIYAPTGSAVYDFYGADRPGNNLFANCLLALDARTGTLLWHFQTVHHDLWDYDNAQAPKLLTLTIGGKRIDAVALAGKTGFIYTFDRRTGRPIFPIDEVPVPASDVPGEVASPTQPVPRLPVPFARQRMTIGDLSPLLSDDERATIVKMIGEARNEGIFTPPSVRGTVEFPGNHGGGQYGNGAIDPRRGRFYVASVEQPAILKLERQPPPIAGSLLAAGPELIFASNCAMCHGTTAKGSPPAVPPLVGIGQRLPAADFQDIVTHGRNQMPAFTSFSGDQIRALHAYLTSLSDQAGKSPLALPGPGVPKPADGLPDPHNLGSREDSAPMPGRMFSGYNFLMGGDGLPAIAPPWSMLSSYDMNSGRLLWRVPYGTHPDAEARGLHDTGTFFSKGSLTATASGLLFSATSDRMLRAWDADNGKMIWQVELPAQPQAIPAIYSVKGRQFIVVAATYSGPGFGSAASRPQKPYRNAYIAYALPRSARGAP